MKNSCRLFRVIASARGSSPDIASEELVQHHPPYHGRVARVGHLALAFFSRAPRAAR
jgi:hypothetical protein